MWEELMGFGICADTNVTAEICMGFQRFGALPNLQSSPNTNDQGLLSQLTLCLVGLVMEMPQPI